MLAAMTLKLKMPTSTAAHEALFDQYSSAGLWIDVEGVTAVIRGVETPLPILARLGMSSEQRLVCTGLVIGDPDGEVELTARSIRDVPVTEILKQVTAGVDRGSMFFGTLKRAAGMMGDSVVAPITGSARLEPSHYAEVLAKYREAVAARPRAPYKYIEENGLLYGSDSTLRRWVREAKRLEATGELEDLR